MKSRVTIPQSPLEAKLETAESIKRDMARLLVELETQATGQAPAKSGSWRHHPGGWLEQNPDKSKA
jgi:hypothetical protein